MIKLIGIGFIPLTYQLIIETGAVYVDKTKMDEGKTFICDSFFFDDVTNYICWVVY